MRVGQTTVTGNLAEDPVLRVNRNSNEQFLTMRLLETARVRNRETNKWEDGETTSYDVAVRDQRMADHIMKSVAKGDRLTVTGNHDVSPYVTASGEAGLNHKLYATDVAASMKFSDVTIADRRVSKETTRDVGMDPWGPRKDSPEQQASPASSAPQQSGFPAAAPSSNQPPQQKNAEEFGRQTAEMFRNNELNTPAYGGPSK